MYILSVDPRCDAKEWISLKPDVIIIIHFVPRIDAKGANYIICIHYLNN